MAGIQENKAWKLDGMLLVFPLLVLGGIVAGMVWSRPFDFLFTMMSGLGVMSVLLIVLISRGFIIVQPNEANILVFFGKYVGSVTESGFWWVNPFTIRTRLSLKIHNHNSEPIKVNDLLGNPIEIAAVVVWKVVDTAKAMFDVEDYSRFLNIQCETAIRALATKYPYDSHDNQESLRGNQSAVEENLLRQVQARLDVAGIQVLETRISHLAYAPEIAQVMLRRQQAEAILVARKIIVEGAVTMVEGALNMLSEKKILELDNDKKAVMINNLLVALVSEHEVTPIVNAGVVK
jgi:regulator of protease activity HflC (stomatin/prohibitin superfamily)